MSMARARKAFVPGGSSTGRLQAVVPVAVMKGPWLMETSTDDKPWLSLAVPVNILVREIKRAPFAGAVQESAGRVFTMRSMLVARVPPRLSVAVAVNR